MRSFITLLILTEVIFVSFWSTSAVSIRHLERKPQSRKSLLSGIPFIGGMLSGNAVNTAGAPTSGSSLSSIPLVEGPLNGVETNGSPSSGFPFGVGSNGGVVPPKVPDNNNPVRRSLRNRPHGAPQPQRLSHSQLALETQIVEYSSLPAIIIKVTDSLKSVCNELKIVMSTKGPMRPEELVPLLTKIKVILAGAISDINLGIVDNATDNLLLRDGEVLTIKAVAELVTELFSLLVVTLGAVKHVVLSSGLRVNNVMRLIIDIDELFAELLRILFSLVNGLLNSLCPQIEYVYYVLFELHFVSVINVLGIRG